MVTPEAPVKAVNSAVVNSATMASPPGSAPNRASASSSILFGALLSASI